jgi:hypothetical protein
VRLGLLLTGALLGCTVFVFVFGFGVHLLVVGVTVCVFVFAFLVTASPLYCRLLLLPTPLVSTRPRLALLGRRRWRNAGLL